MGCSRTVLAPNRIYYALRYRCVTLCGISPPVPYVMTASNNRLNFEQSMEELEAIVAQLEAGQLSLDASLKAYEQGINLTRLCEQALAVAEQRVQKLTSGADGPQQVPLDLPSQDATPDPDAPS